jgi:hypothetical protein
MQELIIWTIAGGSLVFALGLFSALEARKLNRSRTRTQIAARQSTENSSKQRPKPVSAMYMATGGNNGNISVKGEEQFASIGSSTR